MMSCFAALPTWLQRVDRFSRGRLGRPGCEPYFGLPRWLVAAACLPETRGNHGSGEPSPLGRRPPLRGDGAGQHGFGEGNHDFQRRRGRRGDPMSPQVARKGRDPGRRARPGQATRGAADRPGDAARRPRGGAPTARRPSPTRQASPAATSRASEPRSGTAAVQPRSRSSATAAEHQLTPCANSSGTLRVLPVSRCDPRSEPGVRVFARELWPPDGRS
jgi:hypothetical protein